MEVPIYHVGRLIRIPVSSVNKLLKGPMTSDEQDKLITDLLEI